MRLVYPLSWFQNCNEQADGTVWPLVCRKAGVSSTDHEIAVVLVDAETICALANDHGHDFSGNQALYCVSETGQEVCKLVALTQDGSYQRV